MDKASGGLSDPSALKWIVAALAVCLGLLLCALLVVGGSKTGLALAIAVGISPLVLYWSFRRPVLVPLGLYALLIPFNDLVQVNQFGTLTKVLGTLSALALAFRLVHKKAIVMPSLALAAWGAVVVWMALTAVWALDGSLWWALYSTFLQLFVLYALLSLVPVDKQDLRGVLGFVAVGGLAAAAYGIYFFLHGGSTGRLWVETATGATDPNNFAGGLILPIGVVATAALQTKRILSKLGLFAGLVLLISAVYASGSRGVLLAIVMLFAYLLWRSRRRVQIVLFMVGAAIASAPFASLLSSRASTMLSTGGAGRLSIWNVGWEAFKDHWLLGVGVGNFPLAYNEAFIHVYQAVSAGWNRGSHNLLEEFGIELGILGLVLILWAWKVQFGVLKHIGKLHPMYDLRVGLEGIILSLFVASMFADNMYRKYTWLAFAVMMLAHSVSKSVQHRVELRRRTSIDRDTMIQIPAEPHTAAYRQKVVI